MKKFKYLYIGVLSAILSGTFTSCEDYLDVNKIRIIRTNHK